MATGILGSADLSAAADTNLYQVPASTFSVVTVSICNRNASSTSNIRIAICDTTTPGNDEFLEYDSELIAKGVLERTGIVMQAGKYLIIRSSAANVTAVAYGIETSVA